MLDSLSTMKCRSAFIVRYHKAKRKSYASRQIPLLFRRGGQRSGWFLSNNLLPKTPASLKRANISRTLTPFTIIPTPFKTAISLSANHSHSRRNIYLKKLHQGIALYPKQ